MIEPTRCLDLKSRNPGNTHPGCWKWRLSSRALRLTSGRVRLKELCPYLCGIRVELQNTPLFGGRVLEHSIYIFTSQSMILKRSGPAAVLNVLYVLPQLLSILHTWSRGTQLENLWFELKQSGLRVHTRNRVPIQSPPPQLHPLDSQAAGGKTETLSPETLHPSGRDAVPGARIMEGMPPVSSRLRY